MKRLFPLIVGSVLFAASFAEANHGPGTSGGGASTASGETLQAGKFQLTLASDYTDYENISRRKAMAIVERSGGDHVHYDSLDYAILTTLDLQYGLVADFQIGAQIGYYRGEKFREAHLHEDGDAEIHQANVDGLTDLWLTAKWRILKGAPGHLSLMGGVKIPVGDDNERFSEGDLVEPSSQPGTGAWDFRLGVAYSRYLTARLTLDASATYTFRTEHDDFKVGDRLDAGLALNWRLTESIRAYPQWSVFAEVLYIWIGRDQEGGEDQRNTGGSFVFVQPGLRVRFTENFALVGAVAVPVCQELYEDQPDTRWKASLALEWAF